MKGKIAKYVTVGTNDLERAKKFYDELFEDLGVTFQKKPSDGNMKHIAFIKDPDGYWIEIV